MSSIESSKVVAAKAGPERIVALGGGTGLPAVLRGLRDLVAAGSVMELTAVVAMSDDGGSSGRLRRSRGVPPPGDVRNCIVALSPAQSLLSGLFQHRYDGDESELGGHNLGNLILAALAEQTGSFLKAVEASSFVLRTLGRILPVTLEDVCLEATLEDGSTLHGETAIGACRKKITKLLLLPGSPTPTPGVVESILQADLVVIGPGSLYTSVLPNLILPEVSAALRETRAVRVLVGNLVSDRNETSGLDLRDHLRILREHVAGDIVDALLVHEGPLETATVDRYRAEGAVPLCCEGSIVDGVRLIHGDLLADGPLLRHDPQVTARELVRTFKTLRRSRRVREAG